ncbi:hypothetical protein CG91_gp074 [Mycobacterium phage 39HC]|uniref:hypothetical protein n=1 Tax=Mycobacterium phage 39HC TaxID=1463809 RepID=UPI0003F1CF64|nr:hypothetical protein CG91_gp074 [Mycobacterium phage 39HC]AHJ88374.1 hypothetical protein 39HC_074 [Mycobacterium phage 39HC]AHJ88474.1 hypothetical protein 40BC_074 [Mycobacterium phage 40BC]
MTAELIIQLMGGAGVLSGVAALLHYVNARQGTKARASAEAYAAYRSFIETAIDGRDYRVTEEIPVGRQPSAARSAAVERGKPTADTTTRDWCQGCGNIPLRRLMGWTESGLYRCRTCRGLPERPHGLQNPPPRPPSGGGGVVVRGRAEPDLSGIFEEFDAFHTERPVECDGQRGNHGDPAIVCAMCCECEPDPMGFDCDHVDEDWGSSRTVTG